ncbi:AAA family ATPase [[Clostridium] innocuum]
MFYGPSGVGKTETAKYISEMVNGHDDILRKQMSMFASNEYFTYIFGGKHNEITLTKDLLERKSNVILFDEFDKCSSMFYSSFYQMFDEGYVEDRNYKVDLDNAIIICTSNFQNKDEIRKAVGDPIFFRFDKLVEYIPLSAIEQKRIIELIVKKQYTAFTEKEKETFEIEKMIVYYSKLLIGKLMNFRQAESIISDDIWEKLYLNDLQK